MTGDDVNRHHMIGRVLVHLARGLASLHWIAAAPGVQRLKR